MMHETKEDGMPGKRFSSLKAVIPAIFVLIFLGSESFAQRVPAPDEILGFEVGADHHLADYYQALEYLRTLEKTRRDFPYRFRLLVSRLPGQFC